ncbi:kynureninase-like [Penaeus indicus]|uniref:kynureninase-like n=1 Tax=Penaeus indicus TaxID=29960 RepID=UPI00300C1AD3
MSSPDVVLAARAARADVGFLSKGFAELLDLEDPLRDFRGRFDYPKKGALPDVKVEGEETAEECLYFSSLNLGLKPKEADSAVQTQLEKWGLLGVAAYGAKPLPIHVCDSFGTEMMCRLVGADPRSVALMNGLTVNLHLLFISFYQPTPQRYKILTEAAAFCSDMYAFRSQAEMRGYDPDDAVVEVSPREGEYTLRTEDIIKVIEEQGDTVAVVCMSGVQYYTGQKFDMQAITRAAQAAGALVGWDLAHAVGNVDLRLDEWGVDFAFWCSNKYLCSGPGAIGGAYVNGRHHGRRAAHLKGWWSNRDSTRVEMRGECDTAEGAGAFRITTPSPILVAMACVSLQILDEARMQRMVEKQFLLTGFLEALLKRHFGGSGEEAPLRIITPEDPAQRGCQLSILFPAGAAKVHARLQERGVVCDLRAPRVLRVAPSPLYNSFTDVFTFVRVLLEVMKETH